MADDKIYLPRQQVTRGKPGYRGEDIVVVDPVTGKEDRAATRAAARSTADVDAGATTGDSDTDKGDGK